MNKVLALAASVAATLALAGCAAHGGAASAVPVPSASAVSAAPAPQPQTLLIGARLADETCATRWAAARSAADGVWPTAPQVRVAVAECAMARAVARSAVEKLSVRGN